MFRLVPGLQAVTSYRREWLVKDLVAGIVLTTLLVPQGMAYAELAGLPPITGLYTSILCLAGYAVFGPSRILVLGPDSSLGPMIAATILPLIAAKGDEKRAVALASLLAIMVAAIMIVAAVAKLGFIADLISKPTMIGYMNGLALTILIGQLPKLFGFKVSAEGLIHEITGFVKGLAHGEAVAAAAMVGIAGIVLILGPWWLRIARDLVVERQARARAEERADIAARVHDSVLQTLALIQRRAENPQQVIQLARAQERELRSWLFDGRAPGSLDGQVATFAAGVRLIQQDVEAQHGVAVEAVTVGDCELDDNLSALLAAAREATVNAVKWSGASVVSVFAEVEPAEVSLFVRDRGRGFDPAAVPDDRKGLAESVRARMARRGGSATIRSVQGEGTEVSLTMPRSAGQRQPSRA